MHSVSSRLRFPIGESDFRLLRREGYTYVDKSLFIEEVIESAARVLLLPRPRRFGKTLNLSMLRYFLEKSTEDRRDLFVGLQVEQSKSTQAHFQKYPVIFLTLKDAKQDTWDTCQKKIRELLSNLYKEHDYLLDVNQLSEDERELFTAIIKKEASISDCDSALYNLSKYLHAYHKQAPVVLIDEYDSPLHAAFDKGYYEPALSFFRTLLSAVLKDNPHLAKGVLTGILRVTRESIFSGLNNLAVFTLLDHPFSRWFGFTEKEVEELVTQSNLTHMLPEIQRWYNGYLFGKTTVYNPWSVIRYLDNPEDGLKPYWAATASNTLIRHALFQRPGNVRAQIEVLLQGGCLEKRIDENIIMQDIPVSEDALWNFLLFSGYLKIKELFQKVNRRFALLCIPNLEVMEDFQAMTERWFAELFRPTEDLRAFFQSLLEGNSERVKTRLQEILLESLSYHDLAAEVAYHTFMLGLLANLSSDYEVLSNREAGFGRYDVLLSPREKNRPGVVIELKALSKEPSEAEVTQMMDQALHQMETKQYAQAVKAKQPSSLHGYAMVFSGKQVWVKHQLLSQS